MKFMDELKRLAKPYAEDDEDFDDFDDVQEPAPEPTARAPRASRTAPAFQMDDPIASPKSKVVSIHATSQMQVILVKPDRFDTVSEIADHLREKKAVVLNLESTEKDVARRLVDFLSGCAYALDGKIRKIAISTYLITPLNVEIVGDLLEELENSGLYL